MQEFNVTRRQVFVGLGTLSVLSTRGLTKQMAPGKMIRNPDVVYGESSLPLGIRSRFVDNSNGLAMHVLEAGVENKEGPCILLLHGFPELAYSWRKLMPSLAAAGYHVIAPDQRGYGRTTGGDASYDGDIALSRLPNLVRDAVGLVAALGYHSVAAVVGHDFGSPVAAWCSLLRPDVFRSVVLLSAPFAGPPALPFNKGNDLQPGTAAAQRPGISIQKDLAALNPPRKHYQWYYSTREANDNMQHCPQGVHSFLREYYHFKSADWKQNKPFPLASWTAEELAKMPRYYIMDLDKGMAETVAQEAPSAAEIAACRWLPESEFRVYSDEYTRSGFQGGLQWYRCMTDSRFRPELETYSGRTIDVPSCFIAGKSDWGVYQSPGALESMASTACTQFKGIHLVDGAGHWVQQEQPKAVLALIQQFLARPA
jgi:pimeloyl-ACP methyl ester carboxylesterase